MDSRVAHCILHVISCYTTERERKCGWSACGIGTHSLFSALSLWTHNVLFAARRPIAVNEQWTRRTVVHMLNRAVNKQANETCIALITKWYKLGYILHEIKPTERYVAIHEHRTPGSQIASTGESEREREKDVWLLVDGCLSVHGIRGQRFNDLDGLSKWTHSNARFSPMRRARTTPVIYSVFFVFNICLVYCRFTAIRPAGPVRFRLTFKINWDSH